MSGRRRGGRITAAMLLLCGTACTSGGSGGPDAVPPPRSGTGGATTRQVLRVATASDVSVGPVRERLIEAWDRQRDDYTVEIVKLPVAADGVRSQLTAALQSGSADYDVINIDVAWTAEFAMGGLIRPLSGGLPEDMWESVAATARYDGRTWAVPFNTDAGLLYYRTDIWKDENWEPPRTWKQLEEYVEEARSSERVTETFEDGYITQLAPYEGLTVNAQEAVWARGGEFVGAGGEVTADSTEVQYGLEDLYRRYRQIMPRSSARHADEHAAMVAFRDGRVPFMRNWPYVYNLLNASGSEVKGDFGVVPLPGREDGETGVSVLGGQNLAITAHSDQAAAARELLAYLAGPAQQRCLLDAGFAPVLKSTYTRSDIGCSLPEERDGRGDVGGDADGRGGTGGNESGAPAGAPDGLPPYTAPLREALAAARPRPVTPYYAAFTKLIQTEVHALLTDRADLDSIAEHLAERLAAVVEGR
ncbi:extracellular solute-binding protein [Streptomyces sp. NPDC018031]|uniref:extracellular solute-binding protein n=1 Tax=Streptomyces sp. NPDC018031 TaxID=3365033 RepID=UPI00378FC9D0